MLLQTETASMLIVEHYGKPFANNEEAVGDKKLSSKRYSRIEYQKLQKNLCEIISSNVDCNFGEMDN